MYATDLSIAISMLVFFLFPFFPQRISLSIFLIFIAAFYCLPSDFFFFLSFFLSFFLLVVPIASTQSAAAVLTIKVIACGKKTTKTLINAP